MLKKVVKNYILKKKMRRNVKKILAIILEDTKEIKYIDSNVCPFCRERFKNRRGLVVHLQRGYKYTQCSVAFDSMVTDIIARYRAFKRLLSRGSREGRVVLDVDGKKIMFKNYKEAYEYFKKHISLTKIYVVESRRDGGIEKSDMQYIVY